MKTINKNDSCSVWLNNIATFSYSPAVTNLVFTTTQQFGQDTVISVSSDLIFKDSILCRSGVITSVQNIYENTDIGSAVYPNPSNGMITVVYHINSSKGKLELFDMLGKVRGEYQLDGVKTKSEFNLGDLSCGVYVYRIIDNDVLKSEGKLILLR